MKKKAIGLCACIFAAILWITIIVSKMNVVALYEMVSESYPVSVEIGDKKPLVLQYDHPAEDSHLGWSTSALPLGNGHLGAMVFGRTDIERVQMNEKTLWQGGPGGSDEKRAAEKDPLADMYGNTQVEGAMEKYVDYLFKDFYSDHTNIAIKSPQQSGDMKVLANNRIALGNYQNFAEMYLEYNHTDVTDYRRQLDLRAAKTTESYKSKGVEYTREMFISHPDNVMVYRITASEEGALNMTIRPEIPDLGHTISSWNVGVYKYGDVVADAEKKLITLSGYLDNNNMKFSGKFKVLNDGGKVIANNTTETVTDTSDANKEAERMPDFETNKGSLTVSGANSVTIIVSLATNYKNEFPYYRQEASNYADEYTTQCIEDAVKAGYNTLAENHINDYDELFSRVELDLGGVYRKNEWTDEMKSDWYNNARSTERNRYLEELFFQYGRYLTIAASREDSLPSNLQGIWNDSSTPPWQSDYHTNINVQMNYWISNVGDLPESSMAIVNYADSLVEPGRLSAKKIFDVDRGWYIGTSCSPLGYTGAGNSNAMLGDSTSQAFLLQNVYDYYQFTGDKQVLEEVIYPMMKEACYFLFDILQPGRQEWDKDKLYVVPSYSPEHGPHTVGAYYEQQLACLLFQDTLDAAEALGYESETEFMSELEDKMSRLDPISIGWDGQIKEYQHEGSYQKYTNDVAIPGVEKEHRHNSNMMALHPGNLITTETPEYFEAAKKFYELRGDNATGWSLAQKSIMWSRLRNSEKCYMFFERLMQPVTTSHGTAENLWTQTPYQIDANYGGAQSIAEALMQSHAGYIDLLPALPDEWSESGKVNGFVAEGNFKVDYAWESGKVTGLEVTSRSGNLLKVKSGAIKSVVDSDGNKVDLTYYDDGSVGFETEVGETYVFNFVQDASNDIAKVQEACDKWVNKATEYYLYNDGYAFKETYEIVEKIVTTGNYAQEALQGIIEKLDEEGAGLVKSNEDNIYAGIVLEMLNKLNFSTFAQNTSITSYNGTYWEEYVSPSKDVLENAFAAWSEDMRSDADTALSNLMLIDGAFADERTQLIKLLAKNEAKGAVDEGAVAYSLIFSDTATQQQLQDAIKMLEAL